MTVVGSSSKLISKRRRLTSIDPMDTESAKAKLAAAKEKFGREIRVFETSALQQGPNHVSTSEEESDDYYEFTAEDFYRVLGTRKEDKSLKTRKLREAELAARRSNLTKAVIRIRFPDNNTFEVTFHPSETVQCLVDLLTKVIARPDLPFYLYTTPPKEQIKNYSQDFYSAGFVPGAIVYFSYDLPKGGDAAEASDSIPFLQEEIMSLCGLEVKEQAEPVQSEPEPAAANTSHPRVAEESKAAQKKPAKPKWFKG